MSLLNDITNSADLIDVRDIIARVEDLEAERETYLAQYGESMGVRAEHWSESTDEGAELNDLTNVLDALEGMGSDEQWRGVWYPVTLVRDSYFREYAQETAEDCGLITEGAGWPNNCIDWDQAARELRMDYSAIEYGGVTYWTR
jgi:hypothetical protein